MARLDQGHFLKISVSASEVRDLRSSVGYLCQRRTPAGCSPDAVGRLWPSYVTVRKWGGILLEHGFRFILGLDQRVWRRAVLPPSMQGGSLLTLRLCQNGHSTLRQHYHNNAFADSVTLRRVSNSKHLQSQLYNRFVQIPKLGGTWNLKPGGHFDSVLI